MLAWAITAVLAVSPPPVAHVTVDTARLGHAVPRSFLGLSVEWNSLSAYAERAAALRRLLDPLVRSQGGLALRIGGDTEDQAWWNPGHARRPPTVLQDVTPATLGQAAALAGALGGPVTLGVDLALRDPGNAAALVAAARRRLRVDTIEIGNEPDLYTTSRTFHVPGHVHRRMRKRASYSPADYGRDVTSYLRTLRGPRLAVAGFAMVKWWSALPALLDQWGPRASVLGAHLYAIAYCGRRAPPASWLASAAASQQLVARIAPLAALARRRHRVLRVTEMNSAVCGGRRNFSDGPAAAIFLADMLFRLVRAGVRQADVHTWNHAIYAPFVPAGDGLRPRPPLAGLEAFALAAPAGSRLAAIRAGGAVRAWATHDAAGTVRVALLAPRAVRVDVTVPHRHCVSAWTAAGGDQPCAARLTLGARSLAVLSYSP